MGAEDLDAVCGAKPPMNRAPYMTHDRPAMTWIAWAVEFACPFLNSDPDLWSRAYVVRKTW